MKDKPVIATIVAGEAMSLAFPKNSSNHFYKMDSRLPLWSLLGDAGTGNGRVWDLDFYLDKALGVSYTFGDIQTFLKQEGNKNYATDYMRVAEVVAKQAKNEWVLDPAQYVDKTGSGQTLHNGALKILGALAAGMDEIIVAALLKAKVSMVTLFAGLTGGTGAAALLVLPEFLKRSGFTTVIPIGALTHVPSIQVKGKVGEHVVKRVAQMLGLVPNLNIFTGMASSRPDGNTWDDVLAISPKLAELFSNLGKLATTHGTTPNMWTVGMNFRPNMLDKWMVQVLTSVGMMNSENAAEIINMYMKNGYIGFGSPDEDGFHPVVVKNRHLLQLQHLEALLPALLWVKHNPLEITGTHTVGTFFKKQEDYSIFLKGSTMIDDLLKKAGVTTVAELKVNGNTYAGLAAYELWLIASAKEYTQKQALKYWAENWVELARMYVGAAFGDEICFEPGEVIPGEGTYYSWVQPRISAQELVINALSILGEVDDPWEKEFQKAVAEEKLKRQAALIKDEKEEVARRLSKK